MPAVFYWVGNLQLHFKYLNCCLVFFHRRVYNLLGPVYKEFCASYEVDHSFL